MRKPKEYKLKIYTENLMLKYSCSGCKKDIQPSIVIYGNLAGSGSTPYLVLCEDCRNELKEKL